MRGYTAIGLILLLALVLVWAGMVYTVAQTAFEPEPLPTLRSWPTATAIPTPLPPSPTPTVLILPPTWTPTPTFIPSPTPTATPLPATATPTPLPGTRPTAVPLIGTPVAPPSSTLPVPTPVPPFTIPDDAVTILLLGSDKRPEWSDWHTDVVQYVVIYPQVPSVSIVSIPRDLYVYIPNFWMSRINFADLYGEKYGVEGGGFGLLNQTLLYNLGITADFYVKVDFDGLISLVDLLGGIDVPVHCRLEDYWPYPDPDGTYHRIALEPGLHHMDGELALWYARSRLTTSAFSRERRQQQVLKAMWLKGKQMNLVAAAPQMYDQTRDLYQTNLGLGNILSLAVTAAQMDPVNVRRYNIGPNETRPYVTVYGGSVVLPLWERIQPLLNQALAAPLSNRATQNPIVVEVINASGHADWGELAADRLYTYGFIPRLLPAPDDVQRQTLVFFYGETTKGSGVQDLLRSLALDDQRLIWQPDAQAQVKLRLVLGQDYQPCW